MIKFQYRKRYEVTCDIIAAVAGAAVGAGFNTASGMRSHVTSWWSEPIPVHSGVSIPQAV